jgi:hypothetical protein
MRSRKQIAASRESGRKSHGAFTLVGKARIVNANLWPDVFAETHVLTWEYQAELEEIRDEYYTCHPPSSHEACYLLDQIILRVAKAPPRPAENGLCGRVRQQLFANSDPAPRPSAWPTRISSASNIASILPAAPSECGP